MHVCRTMGLVLLTTSLVGCSSPASGLTPPPFPPPALGPCVPGPPPAPTAAGGNAVHQRLASPLSPRDEKAIRAALEQRYEGMSGDGAFMGIAPAVGAIEAASLEEMKKCECCRQVPFGAAQDEWAAFKTQIRDGDTLVYFRNNHERWHVMGGAEGYAIVRSGQVVREFLLSMN